jgi:hypothetical protein
VQRDAWSVIRFPYDVGCIIRSDKTWRSDDALRPVFQCEERKTGWKTNQKRKRKLITLRRMDEDTLAEGYANETNLQ